MDSEAAKKGIYKIVQNAYNAWKRPFIEKIKKFSNVDDALRQRPVDSISEPDWKWLVEYVHSPMFKVRYMNLLLDLLFIYIYFM